MGADLLAALAAPFPPERVSWRVGATTKDKTKGMALAYIDARDVMRRLDEVCGAGGWQCDYLPMPNGTTCCRIGIRIDGEWVWRANGAGATDVEGEKGGYSDAFKRAAVLFGIGRYLYDLDSPWVALDNNNGFVRGIQKSEFARLRALLPGPTAAAKNRSEDRERFAEMAANLRECRSLEAVDELLNEYADTIAAMPSDWRPRWNDTVAQMRQTIQQLEAA
jgi:hypothetical protein